MGSRADTSDWSRLLEQLEGTAGALGALVDSARAGPRSSLRSLSLVVTQACNLSCDYCYQHRRGGVAMTWEVAKTALDVLLCSRARSLSVSLFGGEPLLEIALIRRIVTYLHDHRPPGCSVRVRLTTNGLLLGHDTAAFLAENRVRTRLSFDGVPESQRHRGSGTFAVLDRCIENLARDHPAFFSDDVTVKMTLTSANFPRLGAGVLYLLGRGVARVSISPIFTPDPRWRPEMIDELGYQFEAIAAECRARWLRGEKVPVLELRDRGSRRLAPRGSVGMCAAGRRTFAAVDVDGEAFGCSAAVASLLCPPARRRLALMRLGSIGDPALGKRVDDLRMRISRSRAFGHKEAKRSTYGRCAECRALASCMVCPISVAGRESAREADRVSDLQCAFNLVTEAARRALYREPPQAEKGLARLTRSRELSRGGS